MKDYKIDLFFCSTTKSKTEPKEETGLVNYLKEKITKVGQFFYRSTEAKTDPKVPEVKKEKVEEIKNEEKENIEIKNESSDDAPLVSKKSRKKGGGIYFLSRFMALSFRFLGLPLPPVDLYLISEKSIWTNQL